MMQSDAKLQTSQPKEVGKPTLTSQQIGCLRFSPCGQLLAAGDYNGYVQLWRVSDAGLAAVPPLTGKHNGFVDAIAFAPKEQLLFTADTWGRLSCWDYALWLKDDAPAADAIKPRWSIDAAHDGYIRSVLVSADGKHLATCGRDQIVRLWSTDGKLKFELKEHREDVYALAFSPDSLLVASGNLKGAIHLHTAQDGKHQKQLDATSLYKYDRIQDVGGARVLTFARDGQSLYCGGAMPSGGGFVQATPKLLRFDCKTGKLEKEWTLGDPAHGFVYEIIEHTTGELLLITSGQPGQGRFMLLNPDEKEPGFINTKMANCHAMTLHPGGHRIAIAATNGGSNANGRDSALKNGEYTGNHSPIHLWDLPSSAE